MKKYKIIQKAQEIKAPYLRKDIVFLNISTCLWLILSRIPSLSSGDMQQSTLKGLSK